LDAGLTLSSGVVKGERVALPNAEAHHLRGGFKVWIGFPCSRVGRVRLHLQGLLKALCGEHRFAAGQSDVAELGLDE
jgi:hypothetical protein